MEDPEGIKNDGLSQAISQHNMEKEQLGQGEKESSDSFESIDDTIWVVSKNGKIIMANKSSERLTGYSKEYMQGRNVSDFSQKIADVIEQLQSEPTTPSVVTEVKKNDNSFVSCFATITKQCDTSKRFGEHTTVHAESDFQAIVVLSRSPVFQKQTMSKESESVYNYAVQSVPHGIAILEDVNTVPTLTFHNDAILKCFRQCEGMMKTDFAQAVESVFSPSDVNQIMQAVRDTKQVTLRNVQVSHDSDKMYDMKINPIPGSQGRGDSARLIVMKATSEVEQDDQASLLRSQVLSYLDEGVFFSDEQGQILYHNESFKQRLRNQREGFIGRNVREVLKTISAEQNDWEKIDSMMSRVQHRGRVDIEIATKTSQLESPLHRITSDSKRQKLDFAENNIRILRLCMNPVPEEIKSESFNDKVCFVGVLSDVTAERSARDALRLCERALSSTLEGVLITDPKQPDNPVIYCNSAFEKMTGFSKEEIIGRNCRFLQGSATPTESPGATREISVAISEGRSCTVEILNYRKDGSKFWNRLSISPVKNREGLVDYFVGVQYDISEEKEAEQSFQLRKEALGSCTEGVVISDPSQPDNPIIYCSNSFLRITGYSMDEVIGRNCRFLQGPGTDEDTLNCIREAIAKQTQIMVEILNYRKNGEPFWNLLNIQPVFDKDTKKLSRFVGVQTDITELVNRRLGSHDLGEAKKVVESVAEAKNAFLGNLSHEVRTPLNGIIAAAQLLANSGPSLSIEQRELVNTMLESGTSLLSTLGDILDFSRVSRGDMELDEKVVDLREVIEGCFEMVKIRASEKNIFLAYSYPEEPKLFLGDPIRLRQVIGNLVSNAVKFTNSGEVTIVCRWKPQRHASTALSSSLSTSSSHLTSSRELDKDMYSQSTESHLYTVEVICIDTGIGISPQNMQRLFQSFSLGDEKLSRRFGGTGLGLPLSRRLAELMGGTVWVESEGIRDKGSKFYARFALREFQEGKTTSATMIPEYSGHHRVFSAPESESANSLKLYSAYVIIEHSPTSTQVCRSAREFGMNVRQLDYGARVSELDTERPIIWIICNESASKLEPDLKDVISKSLAVLVGKKESLPPSNKLRSMTNTLQLGLPVRHAGLKYILEQTISNTKPPLMISGHHPKEDKGESSKRSAPGWSEEISSSSSSSKATGGSSLKPLEIKVIVAEDNLINQTVVCKALKKIGVANTRVVGNGLEVLAALEQDPCDLILMDIHMPECSGIEATERICRMFPEPCRRPRIIAISADPMACESASQAGMQGFIHKPFRLEDIKSIVQSVASSKDLVCVPL